MVLIAHARVRLVGGIKKPLLQDGIMKRKKREGELGSLNEFPRDFKTISLD